MTSCWRFQSGTDGHLISVLAGVAGRDKIPWTCLRLISNDRTHGLIEMDGGRGAGALSETCSLSWRGIPRMGGPPDGWDAGWPLCRAPSAGDSCADVYLRPCAANCFYERRIIYSWLIPPFAIFCCLDLALDELPVTLASHRSRSSAVL